MWNPGEAKSGRLRDATVRVSLVVLSPVPKHLKMVENFIEDTAKESMELKEKKKMRKRVKKKAKSKDGLQRTDDMNKNVEVCDHGATLTIGNTHLGEAILKVNSIAQALAEADIKANGESPRNLAQGRSVRKKRRKRVRKKSGNRDGSQSICQRDLQSNRNVSSEQFGDVDMKSTRDCAEVSADKKKRRRRRVKKTNKSNNGSQIILQSNGISNFSMLGERCGESNDDKINKDKSEAQGCELSVTPEFEFLCNEEMKKPLPVRAMGPCGRRKLLILDINGLLADVVHPPPKNIRGDIHIAGRAIFRRPFCRDFLKFCFERFDVGIWSSRSKKIIDRLVDYLLGDLKHKLLFCWDVSHTTETGFRTLENRYKPLVCKELRKLWEKHDPNLPWEKGDYDESNTLLLDDSPHKALLNPVHTAIFPHSFRFYDKRDNSLGPGGDLRMYLEVLSGTDDMQKFVEKHPYGQRAIDETSSFWSFYSEVLCRLSNRLGSRQLPPVPQLSLRQNSVCSL